MTRRLTHRDRDFIQRHRDRLSLGQIARRLRVSKSAVQAYLLEADRGEAAPPAPGKTTGAGRDAATRSPRLLGTALFLAGLMALAAVACLTPITNSDIWLHLRIGRLVLDEGSVPTVERFSFTAAGRPLVPHEWGAAVLFALAHAGAGVGGLLALKVALGIGAFLVCTRTARSMGARPWVMAAPLALTMVLVSARILDRPHMWTFLLAPAALALLDRHRRRGGRAVFLLLPMQAAWANLHGGFPLGILLPGCYLAGEVAGTLRPGRRRRGPWRRQARDLAILLPALLLACLANPVGYRLLLFPFELTGTSTFMETVYEWLPTFSGVFRRTYMFREYMILVAMLALGFALRLPWRGRALAAAGMALAAAGVGSSSGLLLATGVAGFAAAAWTGRGSVPPAHAMVAAAMLLLSVRMNRMTADFALLTLPLTASLWDRGLRRMRAVRRLLDGRQAVAAAAAGALLAATGLGLVRTGYWYHPGSRRAPGLGVRQPAQAAVEFLEKEELRGRAFASYNAANYVIWRLHPAVTVFLDSRNEAYGEEIFRRYLQALDHGPTLLALLEEYQVDLVLLTLAPIPPLEAVEALDREPRFALVFFDDRSAVYVRDRPATRAVIARHAYDYLSPLGVGRRRTAAAAARAVAQEAIRALPHCGRCTVARGALAEAAFVRGSFHSAETLYRGLARDEPGLYLAQARLGDLLALRGAVEEATERYRRALQLIPDDDYAAAQLRSLAAEGRIASVRLLEPGGPSGEAAREPAAQ